MTYHEKTIAKRLGVTPAGLQYLSALAATGAASQRGNEAGPLLDKGLIEPNRSDPGSRTWFVITDIGREVVKSARMMGW
jgi:hypothetical protein